MSADVVARLDDVGKEYVKYEDTPTLLTGLIRRPVRGRRGRLWAVRHMNIEAHRGEAVGVIGRNGAGKSTTLAMLAGVTAPTEGTVSVRGRLAPLLRLGVGFHEELTGRENAYVNCMVLGMTRTEIDRAFDGIVEMAELERFIDTPVKFYSSGMQVRLGFASAVASAPDVMLVDEVLSVGDIAFQAKSFAKMSELREQGSTLLVVSHNLDAIRRTCDRVVVLNGGATVFAGPTNEAITVYHTLLRDEPEYADQSAPAVIHDFRLLGPDSQPTATVHSGDEVTFQMHVRFAQRVVDPALGFWVSAEAGQMVYADNTITTPTGTFEAGESMVCEVRVRLALTTGVYFSGGGLRWGRERFEQVSAPRLSFSIIGRDRVLGVADLGAEFSVSPSDGVVRSEVAE